LHCKNGRGRCSLVSSWCSGYGHEDLFVGNEEELVSDDPDVCVGDEPSSEAGEGANMDG
ncbi:hypothetical protein S245_066027, partial [Arachis hypogaea]